MKITVLGAGAIGSAVAYDLCHSDDVARVQVCEAQPVTLRAYRSQHAHAKLRTYEADARDAQTLEPILAGSACVVSCMSPEPNAQIARLALESGAHFVDLGSPEAIREDQQALQGLAERRQRWVVTGCGLAPGLVGILVMAGLESVEAPRAARIWVGDVPTHPAEPFDYRLAHSAEKLLDDYTQPALVLRDGAVERREPLTGVETVEVDGLGTMESFYTGGGLGTLAEALEGRLDRLDAKTLRYPGHADRMRFLLALGLADRTMLDVRTHLSYRDVLLRRLRRKLGGAYEDTVVVRVEVDGLRDGQPGTLVLRFVDRFDPESGLSAMQRCTGFPAATAARLLATHALPGGGVGPAEAVLPARLFLDAVAAHGIDVTERWEPEA